MSNVEVFRPKSGYYLFGFVVFIALGMVWQSTSGDLHNVLSTLAWATALCSLAYLIYVRPKVVISNQGIEVVNAVVDSKIGWHDVQDIRTKYSMAIVTDSRTIYATAAPAPGRYHARSLHRAELKGVNVPMQDQLRPGDSPRAHSGVAAHLTRTRWQEFQRNGGESFTTETRVNRGAASVPAVLLLIATILSFVHF